jgi:hypothetical protein
MQTIGIPKVTEVYKTRLLPLCRQAGVIAPVGQYGQARTAALVLLPLPIRENGGTKAELSAQITRGRPVSLRLVSDKYPGCR